MSFFKFREKAKNIGLTKGIAPSRERNLLTTPRWYRRMLFEKFLAMKIGEKKYNREHEAERRRRQIERGTLRPS